MSANIASISPIPSVEWRPNITSAHLHFEAFLSAGTGTDQGRIRAKVWCYS